MMRKIVLTGGVHSGKTYILEEFSKQGYATIPETAFQLIEGLNKKLGVEEQKTWRLKNFAEFHATVVKKQLELESNITPKKDGIVFCDRGMYDSIAFCKLMDVEVPQKILDIAKKNSYDLVFLCETLFDFDQRNETGRYLTYSQSLELKELIREVYEEYRCKIIYLKEIPLKDRIKLIQKHLES
ncbi:MAG: ATP-binding protein [Nanoarchaeota archaeon]|nr:ATP-binding protein [Nanoarchaeota archaeon]